MKTRITWWVLWLLACSQLSAAIVQGPVFCPLNQRFYYSLDATNWPAARDEAAASNLTLVTIRNGAEQGFLTNHFRVDVTGATSPNGTNQYLWTGLYATSTGGNFAWLSGEPVTYTNWAVGEPNSFSLLPSYVAINFSDGTWADWSNSPPRNSQQQSRYLAEKTTPGWPDVAWVRNVGDGSGTRMGLAVDGKGNLYVASRISGTCLIGDTNLVAAGGLDIVVSKFSPGGQLQWARQAGGSGSDVAEGITCDLAGNVYITGNFDTNATFGGTNVQNVSGQDIFLAKYDTEGNFLWVRTAGGAGRDLGQEVRVDASGNIYLAGSFQQTATFDTTNLVAAGAADIFLAKYDASGQLLWARRAGGTADDFAYRLAVNGGGEIYVAGIFSSPIADFNTINVTNFGARDMYLAKYTAEGDAVWVQHPGSATDDFANGLALDPDGNPVLAGFYKGTAIFGTNTLPTIISSRWASFLAKYDPAGNVQWARMAGKSISAIGISQKDVLANGIAVDALGNIYGIGTYYSACSFDGLMLAGNRFLTTEYPQIFMVKYSREGNLRWVQQPYYTANSTDGLSLAVDPAGNAYFAGVTVGRTFRFGTLAFSNAAPSSSFAFAAKIPADLPRLTLSLQAGQAQLSWTNQPSGFVLESTADCAVSASWQPVVLPAATNQGTVTVSYPMGEQWQFFRLRWP